MAKQNIKLTKSALKEQHDHMKNMEDIASKQYNAVRNTLNSVKECFDSTSAAAIDKNVSESLKLLKNVSNHMHVGAWCIELVLKNSEVTDDNCAAQIEKLIADPPPEKTIARCLYKDNPYKNYGMQYTNTGKCVAVFNYPDPIVSCTYHTLKRLHDKGLDYPFRSGDYLNGGFWYQDCDTSKAEVRTGSNAIQELYQEYGLPLENIVINFPEMPKPWGHVMLIDRIYEEGGVVKVDFSDMGSRTAYGVFQTDPNGSGFEYYGRDGWTLDRFLASYGKTNGSIGGATLIGRPL